MIVPGPSVLIDAAAAADVARALDVALASGRITATRDLLAVRDELRRVGPGLREPGRPTDDGGDAADVPAIF